MGLIDSHAHLTFDGLIERVDDVLARCREAGVDRVITVGTDLADARKAVALAARFPEQVHPAVGFHPHEADKVTNADLHAMADLWRDPAVVAVGEIGLDYHYDLADRNVQRSVLVRQLEAAAEIDKPIIIHCREAFDDLIPCLLDHGYRSRPVVVHCFTGTVDQAARLTEYGWRISFTGIVTFKRSTTLQEIARSYPLDQLMVETDAPYLSPEPVRSR
ncbi:MAG: TatD family hydrolase, partial [Phycisphaerae bacterium]